MKRIHPLAAVVALTLALPAWGAEPDVLSRIDGRFESAKTEEVPQFRPHVVPLLGKLGCNGRACHGSFQGQGGFRLSLFGYDFEMDHEGLMGGEEPRVNLKDPAQSLILLKPTLTEYHEGGKRYEAGSWEHHVLLRWIEAGAKGHDAKTAPEFVRVEVEPREILFRSAGDTARLRAVAVWSDGAREDVTPLCRFQTNNEQVAQIDKTGLVTAAEPGDTHVVVFYDNGVVPVPVIRPVTDRVGPKYPQVPTPTKVDELVIHKLRKLGVVPSDLSTDAEFLRRVSLDVTGSLPTPDEIERFLADGSPDKRARKIDELLERPTYAAWWTTRLCDFTGNNDDALNNVHPIRTAPGEEWYDWIYERVESNTPYDELVAGIVLATSREPGESYEEFCENMSALYAKDAKGEFADRSTMPYYWARRTFRNPDDRAIGFAYSFMGLRIQCAQCHKHPFDQWTQDDFRKFTGFFRSTQFGTDPKSRDEYQAMTEALGLKGKKGNDLRRSLPNLLKDGKTVPFQEVYAVDPSRGGGNRRNRANDRRPAVTAKLLGGEVVDLTKHEDARQPLMDWLRGPENPFFARAFVNRVWAGYFGIGIVEPADDLSLANPPSNRELLDYLAQGFIQSGYDMKWLHREICNSRTYQLSWVPNETNQSDDRNFSRALPRRLPAEVAYDALKQATSDDAVFARMQTDLDGRAIALAGAGRRNRGVGYALTIFGRSIRESNCDCDRSAEASLLQTVFLRNDQEVAQMIDDRRDGWVAGLAGESGIDRKGADAKRPANYEKTVATMRAQIVKLRKAGKKDELRRATDRLADYRQRFDRKQPEKKPARQAKPMTADEIIEQAYLRTLSRYPDEQEQKLSRAFLNDADSPADGARDLLWALVNTKEFIVNH